MIDIEKELQKLNETSFFLCWSCDSPVELNTDNPILRVFCDECRENYKDEKKATLNKYLQLKMRVMHERSLRFLEKQQVRLYKYKDASEIVLEAALENPSKFGSSHEMMAAMELIRHKIHVKTQQKIDKHRVDFLIPNMNVVLEIDGYMHKHYKLKDSQRDIEVRESLGAKWEVIRIPTKYIEQNVSQLIIAIQEVYKYKKEIRLRNQGLIPEWYSKRERERYKSLFLK